MAEIISWTLVIMTIGFVVYWLISFFFLTLGFYLNVGINTLEFFRLWLKKLFVINFSWFLLIELVFSLIYWFSFVLLKVVSFAYPGIRFLNGLRSEEPDFYSWSFFSLLIYCVVMIPYFFLQYRLSHYFKKLIFTKLAGSFNAQNPKFYGQSRGLHLDKKLFARLAANDSKTKNWINQSFEDHASKPGDEDKRFSIEMTSTDHMSWVFNNKKADFFEALIEFDGTKKVEDEEGKVDYKTALSKELFDGIVICMENIFENSWEPTLFKTIQIHEEMPRKNRKIHKQNYFIKIYNETVFKAIATKKAIAYNNSSSKDYVEPETIKIKTNSQFRYLFCNKNNLYLLLHTDLENTAFDLNMNIPVKKSVELFKQDLSLVHSAIGEIQLILEFMEENNIQYSKQVA